MVPGPDRPRSIPAWAGETQWLYRVGTPGAVYPRVGGGNSLIASTAGPVSGLSPRGRGKLQEAFDRISRIGSIPAWAGETYPVSRIEPLAEVYPRVGGGNWQSESQGIARAGLSPRGRGKLSTLPTRLGPGRSIPAWAGETDDETYMKSRLTVYPRVGGGNYSEWTSFYEVTGLSPRGRGKHHRRGRGRRLCRSIPAWAGETSAGDG